MSSKQLLLDAIDRAQEAIDDVHQAAVERDTTGTLDKEPSKRKRVFDKAYINVALLEQYMPLCEHLAVGHRPMKAKDLEILIHDNNIRYIFNLRPQDGDKGLWYVPLAKSKGVRDVIHIPLETSVDKGRTRVENHDVSRVASRVVACMRELENEEKTSKTTRLSPPTVYIHGYANAHVAMVVGMVAWYMYRDDNRFDPLEALVERYDASIAAHYPEHWFHRQQVTRICDMERRSVYAALKRAKINVTRRARHKHDKTNGASKTKGARQRTLMDMAQHP